jgi:hypothetical protein
MPAPQRQVILEREMNRNRSEAEMDELAAF